MQILYDELYDYAILLFFFLWIFPSTIAKKERKCACYWLEGLDNKPD